MEPGGKSPSPTAADAGPTMPPTEETSMQDAHIMPENFFIIDCCKLGCDDFMDNLKALLLYMQLTKTSRENNCIIISNVDYDDLILSCWILSTTVTKTSRSYN